MSYLTTLYAINKLAKIKNSKMRHLGFYNLHPVLKKYECITCCLELSGPKIFKESSSRKLLQRYLFGIWCFASILKNAVVEGAHYCTILVEGVHTIRGDLLIEDGAQAEGVRYFDIWYIPSNNCLDKEN